MRYFRVEREGSVSLVAKGRTAAHDLTETAASPESFLDLAFAASLADESIDDIARSMAEEAPTVDLESAHDQLRRPVDPDEIWGAGVTYAISQESREDEGGLAESYIHAYEADRPEVYFKATPSRTVGPGDAVGIRGDSDWDVAEPELTIVLHGEEIVGYTAGVDMCSRSIERENLLYLPQSKIYAKSCAIGPCVATEESIGDPLDVEMELSVSRDGRVVFEDSTSTSEMVRTCEELVDYYTRYNEVPSSSVLLTGTSIIPPDEVTLEDGDTVRTTIENVGTLENTVERL